MTKQPENMKSNLFWNDYLLPDYISVDPLHHVFEKNYLYKMNQYTMLNFEIYQLDMLMLYTNNGTNTVVFSKSVKHKIPLIPIISF